MNISSSTICIPRKLRDRLEHGGRVVSDRLQELALSEIPRERPLQAVPTNDLVHVHVDLPSTLKKALPRARKRMPGEHAWTNEQVLAALASTALMHPDIFTEAPTREDCTRVLGSIPGLKPRPEQLLLSRHVDQALEFNKIAMLEGATGSGKGLVLAAASVAAARRRLRTAIAAPSHQIADQIAGHLSLDLASQIPRGCRISRVYGRNSFVSGPRLLDAISDRSLISEPVREAALAWLDGQDRLYLKGERTGLYLIDPLIESVPEIPHEDIRLRSSDACPSADCYDAQFEAARQAGILILTHAMLAALTKNDYLSASRDLAGETKSENLIEHIENLADVSVPTLGKINVLLIDEAHMLETLFSHAMSQTLSLRSLERLAERLCDLTGAHSRGGGIAKAAFKRIAAMAELDVSDVERQQALGDLSSALKKILKATSPDKTTKTYKIETKSLREVKALREEISRSANAIAEALVRPTLQMINLTFSPHKHFPQVMVGPRSVRRFLEFMWRKVDAAVAVSATLYSQTVSGVPSCAMMAARLSIDPIRRITHIPVLPSWLTDSVTLHVAPDNAKLWIPPSADASATEFNVYYTALSNPVNRFCESARGGTLVLCTSYQAIAELAVRWDGDPSRLVLQSRDEPFAVTARKFARLALAETRPVLIATGQAWTGFNIYSALPDGTSAPPPKIDDLLTHLLITRAPFDNMTSSTELARRQKRDPNDVWPTIAYECQMRLRQGVGRLVRRPDVRDRHIAILDPRVCAPGFRGMSMLRNLWAPYQRQVVIDQQHPFKARQAINGTARSSITRYRRIVT